MLFLDPPGNTKVLLDNAGVFTEGDNVSLTCSSDANPPVESYTWFRVNESTPVGSGQQYSITSIRSEDGGEYYCETKSEYRAESSSTVSITVADISLSLSLSPCLSLSLSLSLSLALTVP